MPTKYISKYDKVCNFIKTSLMNPEFNVDKDFFIYDVCVNYNVEEKTVLKILRLFEKGERIIITNDKIMKLNRYNYNNNINNNDEIKDDNTSSIKSINQSINQSGENSLDDSELDILTKSKPLTDKEFKEIIKEKNKKLREEAAE